MNILRDDDYEALLLFLGLEDANRYMYDMIFLLLCVDTKYMNLSIMDFKIKVIYNLLIH